VSLIHIFVQHSLKGMIVTMPTYTYRRENGTTFEIRQKFSDAPLETDPETGQKVQRVVHAAGIVFKGSGFYVNDSKGSKANLTTPKSDNGSESSDTSKGGAERSNTTPSETTPSTSNASSDAAD
jgi:putative FmdB family regulatory protein